MNGRCIDILDEHLKSVHDSYGGTLDDKTLVKSQDCPEGLSLQMLVLDKAFQTLIEKYQRHLTITGPALEKLLAMNEKNHEASDLKELLAVKISLAQFERNIQDVKTEVNTFSKEFCEDNYKDDLRMIVEFFNHNIQEVEFEMRTLTRRVEDCEQFVSIHLDTVRCSSCHLQDILENLGTIHIILLQESNYENRGVLRVCCSDKWLRNARRGILRDEHDIWTRRNTPCLGSHRPAHHSIHGSHHGLLYEGIFFTPLLTILPVEIFWFSLTTS